MRTATIIGVATTSTWTGHALATLRAAGYRSGGARAAVIGLLGRESCCLTVQQIFDRLRDDGRPVGIASVYRALDLLVELRLAQRIELGEGTWRFEALDPSGDHHHHVVCDDCGRVEAFSDERLEVALTHVADDVGFAVLGHDVVLRGACTDCRE
jgi:Fur family transcriptional regulator, ferric uptake regulator